MVFLIYSDDIFAIRLTNRAIDFLTSRNTDSAPTAPLEIVQIVLAAIPIVLAVSTEARQFLQVSKTSRKNTDGPEALRQRFGHDGIGY